MSLIELFEEEAKKNNGLNPAIVCEGKALLTYANLKKEVDSFVGNLNALKLKPGTRIGIYLPRSPDLIISILAIMKAEHIFIPMPDDEKSVPMDRLKYFIDDAKIELIITNGQSNQKALLFNKPLLNRSALANPVINTNNFSSSSANDDKLAYIIYTSGSTGKPKGVKITRVGLENTIEAAKKAMHITSKSRFLQFASIGFDASLMEILTPLIAGACVCIFPRDDLSALSQFCKTHSISTAILTPSILQKLNPHDFKSFEYIVSTGEKLYQETFKKWALALENNNGCLFNGWGPTEASIGVTFGVCKSNQETIHVGTPIDNMEIYILEEDGCKKDTLIQKKIGEAGEVYLAGPGLAEGYCDAKLTYERFREVTVISAYNDVPKKMRLFQTRDKGRLTEENNLEVIARLDRAVKVHGEFVSPEEIEENINAVSNNKFTSRVETILHNNSSRPATFIAYLFLSDEAKEEEIDLEDIRRSLSKNITPVMLPARWVISNKQPQLTGAGKTDYSTLLSGSEIKLIAGVKRVSDDQNSIEHIIGTIWRDVLDFSVVREEDNSLSKANSILENQHKFNFDDNFYYLGGTSLQAAQMLSALEARLGIKIKIIDFLSNPTLGFLVRRIIFLREPEILSSWLAEGKKTIDTDQITIQNKNENVPLVLLHSLVGDASNDYVELQRLLPGAYSGPIIEINALGLRHPNLMPDNFEELAAYYISMLEAKYPHQQDWILGGWSSGGTLAIEMQYQLNLKGKKAAILTFDAIAPTIFQKSNNRGRFERFITTLFFNLDDHVPEDKSFIRHSLVHRFKWFNHPELKKQIYDEFTATYTKTKKQRLRYLILQLNNYVAKQLLAPEDERTALKGLLSTIEGILNATLDYQPIEKIELATFIFASQSQQRYGNRLGWPENWKMRSATASGDHFFMLQAELLKKLHIPVLLTELKEKLIHPSRLPKRKDIPVLTANFTGRVNILEKIKTNLLKENSSDQVQAIVLWALNGMGGVGKTTLAVKLTELLRDDFESIIWFNAENETKLQEKFVELGKELGLPEYPKNPQKSVEQVVEYLHTYTNWLLIFDNAIDALSLQPYIPITGGKVIVTSRHSEWEGLTVDYHPEKVECLSLKDAVDLLMKITGNHNQDLLEELANVLGRLPKALEIAAAHIKEYGKLEEFIVECKNTKSLSGIDNEVDIASHITTRILFKEVPGSKKILFWCSYLSADKIPISLLKECYQLSDPDSPGPSCALNSLVRYNLMGGRDSDATVSIHRLVQTSICKQLNGPEDEKQLLILLEVLGKNFHYHKNALLPHVQEIAAAIMHFFKESRDLNLKVMPLLAVAAEMKHHALHSSLAAIKMKKLIVGIYEKFEPGSKELSNACYQLAHAYRDSRQYNLALEQYEKAKSTGGQTIELINEINENVATVKSRLDGGAAHHHDDSVSLRRRELKDDPTNVQKKYRLAYNLIHQGDSYLLEKKYDAAVNNQNEALILFIEAYGKDTPGAGWPRIHLGNAMLGRNNPYDYKEIEILYQDALKNYELDNDIGYVALSCQCLGNLYEKWQNYPEAVKHLKRAYEIYTKNNEKINKTINVLFQLAEMSMDYQKFDDAEKYLQTVKDNYKKLSRDEIESFSQRMIKAEYNLKNRLSRKLPDIFIPTHVDQPKQGAPVDNKPITIKKPMSGAILGLVGIYLLGAGIGFTITTAGALFPILAIAVGLVFTVVAGRSWFKNDNQLQSIDVRNKQSIPVPLSVQTVAAGLNTTVQSFHPTVSLSLEKNTNSLSNEASRTTVLPEVKAVIMKSGLSK